MKRLFAILWIVLTAVACVGQKDDPEPDTVLLLADRLSASIDAGETVTFTVLCNGGDITDKAAICNVSDPSAPSELDSNIFVPTEEGTYLFAALYNGIESPTVRVEAYSDGLPDEEERTFYRHSLITKFTATWCVNCPAMSEAVHEAEERYYDRIIDIAVHSLDSFAIEEGQALVNAFGIEAFPTVIVDMDGDTALSVASPELLLDKVYKSGEQSLPAGGIKIESLLESDKLAVEVEITAAADADYRMFAVLVRDGIVAAQVGGGNNYVHTSVLRKSLGGSLAGAEVGRLEIGDTHAQHYECPIAEVEKPDQTRIIVCLLAERANGTYTVNNVAQCAVGSSVGYRYER